MLRCVDSKTGSLNVGLTTVMASLVVCSTAAWTTACTPLASFFSSSKNSKKEQSAGSKESDRPLVSNAFAYARYVAMNLQPMADNREWNEASVRGVMIDRAVATGVQPDELLNILSNGEDKSPTDADEGATLQRIALFEEHFERCKAGGERSAIACCETLAWPLAVLPEWKSLEPAKQASLRKDAKSGDENTRRQVFESWGIDFRLQGLKAWLSVCHSVVTKQPETLTDFRKSEWFTPASNEAWNKRLHARSRAKQGPRRIQTRQDGLVAVAETLKPDDCSVTETEVIIRRPDGALNFWVYDAAGKKVNRSHFPAPGRPDGSQETVEKPSPDACMGCHYDLKARTFDVLFPSADDLNLAKTSSLPVVCRLADEPIADDN